MNRGWLATCAVAVCVAVSSCATLPTSGSIRIKAVQDNGVQGQAGVQFEPVPPGRNWTPKEIVRGFLAASASFAKHHRVAKDYLTVGFAKAWHPGWGATVVGNPHFKLTTIPHNVVTGGPQRSAITVNGQRFARLLTEGQDQAGSVVVAPPDTVFHFSLVREDGQWRIDSVDESVAGKPGTPAPTSLLLLTRSDFERDYLARNIYFFRANGSSSKMLLPDPVYIPQTGLVAEVRGLVSALLQPRCRSRRESSGRSCPTNPPDTSWLFGAATTAFPPGVRTVRPVQVLGGVRAIVDLGSTAAKISPAQRKRMAAQLAWSLTESPYGAQTSQIRSVVLQFAHGSLTASLEPGWVPRAEDTSLYYQVPGGTDQPAQVVLRAPNVSQPYAVNVPRQLGNRPFTSMAVLPVPQLPTPQLLAAVVAGCIGKTLYLMPHSAPQDVTSKRLPDTCTSLSWDAAGNLWIATTSGVFEMPGAGNTPPRSALIRVLIPPPLAPPPRQAVQSLRIAPDGVRVAMIVPSGQTSRIMVAAISKNGLTYIAETQKMLRVGSDLQHPLTLSWLDPDHLLVLDQAAPGRNEIYDVPLNGGVSTEITTPPGVASMSAIWPRASQNPQIAIGIKGTATRPGKIEISRGSLLNPSWRRESYGEEPVFPG
jgi:Lipoprotein LpqB beta-propeller domain/Sporulation and spore germination